MNNEIRIFIADDHPIYREGLKQIIENERNMRVIGEADNGLKALEVITEKAPDIALLDIDMPKMTGLEVLKKIADKDVKVVFLTMYSEEDIFDEAMGLGIKGYVLKDSAVDDIIECINSVNEGNYFISPSMSNLLMKRRQKMSELRKSTPMLDHLTPTEKKILRYISQNKTSKEIADILFLSPRTVENHRTNISNKLDLKGSHSLMKFAIENKSLLSN